MSDEWDGIEGWEQWQAKLDDLLKQADAAARGADDEARFAVSSRLTDFIMHSRPNDEPIKAMDEIAKRAAQDLLLQTVQERVREIAGRTAELRQLAKGFRDLAETASSAASEIRLQKAHRLTRALTDSVHLLKDFATSLDTSSDAELIRSLQKAMDTIQKLRAVVERET
jgi:signal transduction histidine kinase